MINQELKEKIENMEDKGLELLRDILLTSKKLTDTQKEILALVEKTLNSDERKIW